VYERAPTRREVERPLHDVLDPAFRAAGWKRARSLRWRATDDTRRAAKIGFSRWNGMAPLPNRCGLDFQTGRTERGPAGQWYYGTLLTESEQRPLTQLVLEVRRRVDRSAVADAGMADLLDQVWCVPLDAASSWFEYLTVDDLIAQVYVLAERLPTMIERVRSSGESPPPDRGAWRCP
jgi:hypothetical protein